MVKEVKHLDAKDLILTECGHGDRAFRCEAPNYLRTKFDFNALTSVEFLAEYIRSGRVKVDKEINCPC